MTNIVEEVQLDYCDVMIKPKRSTLNSRSEPDIYRTYKMKHTNRVLYGNGLMVANMATTGTFAMAEVMANNLMFTCLHKHYSFEDLKTFLEEHKDRIVFENSNTDDESKYHDFLDYVFVSTGIKDGDYEKICKVLDLGYCKNLCIDIANGYIPKLLDFVKKIRKQYPDLIIMVGNVVTGDMVQDIILAGADIVKCGIGPGCFTGDMKIKTKNGLKCIKDINESDEVLTHTGNYRKVINKFCYTDNLEVITINDIVCTPKHLFLVADKSFKYRNIKFDDTGDMSLSTKLKWVAAEDLDEDSHLLIDMVNSKLVSIVNKSPIRKNTESTYDIEVEQDHSYNINGIIVHNSNCTTRKQTGCGRPQLSAVIECAEAAHAVDGMLCADGGITCVGDINKAYGAGADFVMVGSLVAGSDEADGDVITKVYETNEYDSSTWIDKLGFIHNTIDDPIPEDKGVYVDLGRKKTETKKFKLAYGMSSKYAQDKHWNGMAKYRASEGIVTLKPYSGPVQNTIDEYLGGLRSCMTYISARRLKDIPKCCTFYKANRILNNDGKGIM